MIALLENLVNIPSPTGNENEVGDFLVQVLAQQGFKVIKQAVEGNRFNIVALTKKSPTVLLSTHFDVVPPHIPCSIQGDTIRGRGACDAKGIIVAMMMAADNLLDHGIEDFGLLFVVGEEAHSDGAKKAAELELESDFIIIGEPTENELAVGQKGTLVFRAHATGKRGHSAYPELGESAIHVLIRNMQKWLDTDWGDDPVLGKTTLNIGKIDGGEAMNIIAGQASVEGIFRIATSVEDLNKRIEKIIDPAIFLEILSESQPQKLLALDGFETTVVSFGSDASYLRKFGHVLLTGPGSILNAHSDHEFVLFSDIQKASVNYFEIVKRLLKRK